MKYIVSFLYIALCIPTTGWGAERIISTAPSNTSILLSLGLADSLVGICRQCEVPGHVHAEYVGEFASINIEKIVSLEPDIIFTNDGVQERVAQQLKNLGLPVTIISPKTIPDIIRSIKQMGSITHTGAAADAVIKDINRRLSIVDAAVSSIPEHKRPSVFVEIWHSPLTTAGSTSFIHEIITRAGGTNIAGIISDSYPRINPEWVVLKNPDIIILGYHDIESEDARYTEITKRPGWHTMNAVQNNEIHGDIPYTFFLQPGPQVADGVELINKVIMRVFNNTQ